MGYLDSGIEDFEKEIDFTCQYCENENVSVLAGGRGSTLYVTCAFCKEDSEIQLD